jgi:hypothetical protein
MIVYILEAHATDEWRIGKPPKDRYTPDTTSSNDNKDTCTTSSCMSHDDDVMCDPLDGAEGCVRQHHNLSDRLLAARRFVSATKCSIPTLIDCPVTNSFENTFAAWPTRAFILHRGRLAFIAWPRRVTDEIVGARANVTASLSSMKVKRSVPVGEYEFNFEDVQLWLREYRRTRSTI